MFGFSFLLSSFVIVKFGIHDNGNNRWQNETMSNKRSRRRRKKRGGKNKKENRKKPESVKCYFRVCVGKRYGSTNQQSWYAFIKYKMTSDKPCECEYIYAYGTRNSMIPWAWVYDTSLPSFLYCVDICECSLNMIMPMPIRKFIRNRNWIQI